VFLYLDDRLVASQSMEEHRHHLCLVLQLLQANGLVIMRRSACLGKAAWSSWGIRPLLDRVAAVKNFLRPTTIVEMQAFLVQYNNYCHFVSTAAQLLKQLTNALQSGLKPHTMLKWSPDMVATFDAARSHNA
jgi:hypothetical protein